MSSNSFTRSLYVLLTLLQTYNSTILKCSSSNPCIETQKVCNTTQECIIQCIGNGVCANSQFICPTNNDCTLICDSYASSTTSSCKNVHLIALNIINTDVSIICGNNSCQNLLVNASNAYNLNFISNQTVSVTGDSDNIIIYAEYLTNTLNIICNGDNTCDKSIIYANSSNNINIIANGANTLSSTHIYAYNAASFKLSCNSLDKIGCNYPSLYLPILSSSNIELNCTGLGCRNLILYTQNGFSDIDTLYVDGCNSCKYISGDTGNSCIYLWTMHCNTYHTYYTQSTYFWGSYCDNNNCGCMDYGLPMISNAWRNSDMLCLSNNATITCENSLVCDINCSEYRCSNTLINALHAVSVTITCPSYQSCDSLVVYCPNNNNSICNLICVDHRSCDEALLYATNEGAVINMYCNNSYSCNSMRIYAYNSRNVSLFCHKSNSCHHLTLFAANSNHINVLCDGSSTDYFTSSCYSATIHAQNANKLQLKCDGNYSCCNNYIFAQNTQQLLITAYGNHGLYAPYIYAQDTDNFTLTCIGYDTYFACQQLELYIEGSQTNINCIGFGCQTLTIYDHNISNDINTVSVIGDCSSCNSTYLCIIDWDVQCSATKQDYFDGVACESNECGCHDLKSKVENGWTYVINENDECYNNISDDNIHKQDGISESGYSISWIAIIAIVISLLIMLVLVLSIYVWYHRKQQSTVIDIQKPVSPVISLQNLSGSNVKKKQKTVYKQMVDEIDEFENEEGR